MAAKDATTIAPDVVSLVNDLRAELAACRAENAQLRNRVDQLHQAVVTRTGADPQPVVQRQQTIPTPGQGYDTDPTHHHMVVDVIMRGGTDEEVRAAIVSARELIKARMSVRGSDGPPRVADYQLADREGTRQANFGMDMASAALVPTGGAMTRNPTTGQVTVRLPAQLACEQGHAAQSEDRFCRVCGSPVAAPRLGQAWSMVECEDGHSVDLPDQTECFECGGRILTPEETVAARERRRKASAGIAD